MVSPSFLNVANAVNHKFKLSDISISGYDPEEGTGGDLKLTTLTVSGREDKAYYWYETEDCAAGWWDANGEVPYEADKIEFDAGQAFWVQGEGLTVKVAGQVNTDSVSFSTPSGGKVAIGNPFPVALKLSNINVTGYDPEEGTGGDLKLTTLTVSGREDKAYYWYETEDCAAGWWDANGEVPYEADKIDVPVAQGYWVQGEGLTVNFDKLDL